MSTKVVCLITHGIGTFFKGGTNDPNDIEFGQEALQMRVAKKLKPKNTPDVVFDSIVWTNIEHETRQNELFEERRKFYTNNRLANAGFILAINNLSDASAYQHYSEKTMYDGSFYRQAHVSICRRLYQIEQRLKEQGVDTDASPVVLCAHSMGCHVMSNYQWDMTDGGNPDRQADITKEATDGALTIPSRFMRLDTVSDVTFFGCNLPLLLMGLRKNELVPIRIPRKSHASWRTSEGTWFNCFDPDDYLGYHLESLFAAYYAGDHPKHHDDNPKSWRKPGDNARLKDIKTETPWSHGGIGAASHLKYWQTGRVAKTIASQIQLNLQDMPTE